MRKIEIGLDLTKEIKNLDNFIVQGDPNPDMDKIRESAKNVGLDLTKNQSSVIEYPRYLYDRF
jgi:sporulation-control protein spo0M